MPLRLAGSIWRLFRRNGIRRETNRCADLAPLGFATDKEWRCSHPSAAIRGEWNILLNPIHSDVPKIQFRDPIPFEFDVRMFR
jgi:hypothetical protein